jgi:hypothetical protein
MFPGGVKGGPVYNAPVTAAVLRSQGTQFLGMTIWNDLNTGWQNYGATPVDIDYTSLAGSITPQTLADTDVDVLIISLAQEYSDAEAAAITDYVQAGHGLIITYATFRRLDSRTTKNSDLAPLVGLSETISPGTNTWPDPIVFDLSDPNHPIFAGMTGPYETGVPFMVSPFPGTNWDLTTGVALAQATPSGTTSFTGNGLIIANEAASYRSVYFPHYIENKSDGSNDHDIRLFYNSLLWTNAVPEPGTMSLLMVGVGSICALRRSRLRVAR